jgi:hypothetical protein
MGVFCTPVDRGLGPSSNRAVPTYTVTADDRRWFDRCRRAWDFGAQARQGLRPLVAAPTDPRPPAFVEALAVHYFPGMWAWDRAIVEPLVTAAYDRAGGPEDGRPLLGRFQRWAPTVDGFTPIRVQFDLDIPVPDPADPEHHLVAPTGERVRYRDRVHLAVLDDEDQRCWLVEHRVVEDFADGDELVLDERGLLACWAWNETELALPVAGTRYTELRVDPPGFKRTVVPRTSKAIAAAAERLGRTVLAMLDSADGVDPTPIWTHCQGCLFRSPCVLMQRGEDASQLVAAGYVRQPPDDLEEGRLGGVSWGMGRGAAPRRF